MSFNNVGRSDVPILIETKAVATFDENSHREGSRNVRKLYTDKIRQIDEWLADPLLRKWTDGIERASKKV